MHHAPAQIPYHELWLIYNQLKDAESVPGKRLENLEVARERLGHILNFITRESANPDFRIYMANNDAKSGAATTEAKAAAARANGAKGGRPKDEDAD